MDRRCDGSFARALPEHAERGDLVRVAFSRCPICQEGFYTPPPGFDGACITIPEHPPLALVLERAEVA